MLASEDHLTELRRLYQDEEVGVARRRQLMVDGLALQERLHATVQAKRVALDRFLGDVDTRIGRMRDWLAEHPAP